MKTLFFLVLLVINITPNFGQEDLFIEPYSSFSVSRVYDEFSDQTSYNLAQYDCGYYREFYYQLPYEPYTQYYKYFRDETVYRFNFSLPQGAYNISATVEAFNGSCCSGQGKIVTYPDVNYSNQPWDVIWENIFNASELFTVDGNPGTYHDITSMITSRLSQGYINLAVRASNYDTQRNISIFLRISFDTPIAITAQNNFSGGKIYIDNVERDAPYPFTRLNGETVLLRAKEQNDNLSYPRIWNDIEAPIALSRWYKNNIPGTYEIEKSFIVAQSDDGSIYEAGLRKNYLINRINQTEFDGNQTLPGYIVEQNSGQISTYGNGYTPGTIPYNFVYWTDNLSTATTRTVTPPDNSNYTALYKASHKSNQTNAYSNSSQRRFIQTPDGVKHICYESMNRVWLEHSTDNGATWFLGNAGKPLSSGEAKNPSVSFYGNVIGIVWQEKSGSLSNINMKIFYSANYATSIFSTIVSNDCDYVSNANPVVGWGYNGKAVVVWSGLDYCSNPFGATQLKYWYGNASSNGISGISQCGIVGTDVNSINPTIACNYLDTSSPTYFHFAWQQNVNSSTQKINYCKLYASGNNLVNTTVEEASLNSGYSKNYNPVITLKKINTSEYVYVTWLGNRTSPTTETRVLLKYKLGSNWSTTGVYGTSPVQNFSINKGTTTINGWEPTALCWSEPNGSSFYNKLMKSPGSGILTLSSTGKDMQINNGTTFSSMFANSFSSVSLPYSFNLSQNFGAIGKENSLSIFNGREGIVGKNGAQFFFALGDISVNGQNINFLTVPDSVTISSLQLLNSFFESEPFTVNSNSNLIYGVQYGITDSVLCSSALTENENIDFRVELIDAETNEILGVYDEVTYTAQNVFQYNNIGYQVNLSDIGERTVKFRLVTNTNAEFSYGLANRFADQSLLAKNINQTVNYQGSLAVTDYALEQNYPNPFNPSTTIKFQLPKDGMVTLKVYDILGNEITTLINEQKPQGRYEVNFNASQLASGVYIYKIQAGDFVSSKKMLLIK